jgi:hypothetical protein
MIWFTPEEAAEVEISLEALRICDSATKLALLMLGDSDTFDEFLESWR